MTFLIELLFDWKKRSKIWKSWKKCFFLRRQDHFQVFKKPPKKFQKIVHDTKESYLIFLYKTMDIIIKRLGQMIKYSPLEFFGILWYPFRHQLTRVGVNCSNCNCSTRNCSTRNCSTRNCSTLLAGNQLLDTFFVNCSNPVNPG